jgi:hypothetical protein
VQAARNRCRPGVIMTHVKDANPERDPDTDIPISSRFSAYKCEHCDNVHIILFDDDHHPFAYAVLSDEMVLGIMDVFNNKIRTFPDLPKNQSSKRTKQ